MIVDILLFIISVILSLLTAVLSGIGFLVPVVVVNAIHQGFLYLGYVQGMFPMLPDVTRTGLWHSVGLLTIFGFFVQMLVAVYLVKLFLWIYGFMPWSKHPHHLPRS